MKSKFILFLIIQFSYSVNEGSIELNENNKKSDDNKSEGSVSPETEERHKREGSPGNVESHERDEDPKNEVVAEDDTSSESFFNNDDGMSKSVIYVEETKQTKPDSQSDANKFDSSSNVSSENDNSSSNNGLKETMPDTQSAFYEFDDTRNVSLSGNNGLKETDPDTQSPLDPKNFSPENGPSEENKQSKLEEDMNTEKQEDKAVDKLEDSGSSKAFINSEQPGVTKTETSPINNTQSDNSIKDSIHKDINIKNNTTNDIEDEEESLNYEIVAGIQEEERSSSNTKDVDNSKTPLTSKSTETKEVNEETEVITENLSSRSKINEGKTLSNDKGALDNSLFDFKNDSFSDIVNKTNVNDNKNSSIDADKSATMPLTDGNAINPTIDNEGTNKDKDTEILNKNPFDFGTKPLSLNDEHIQTNNIITDSGDKSQSSLKIETKNVRSEFTSNANPKGNDKESSTVIKTSLDIGTESLTNNTKDDETKIISDKDVNVAGHLSKVDRENTQNPGSSIKDNKLEINDKDISVAGHSFEVEKESAIPLNINTKDDETQINDKDVNIADRSYSEVVTESAKNPKSSTPDIETKVNYKDVSVPDHSSKVDKNISPQISSTKDNDSTINDKDLNVAGPSYLGAGTKPVSLPTNSTVTKDVTNDKSSSKENNDEKINVSSGTPKDNSRKRFIKSFNDLQQHINAFNQGTSSIFTGGTASGKVDNNENINQNVDKNITTGLIESERFNAIETPVLEGVNNNNNENITQSVDKDINTNLIESERSKFNEGTASGEVEYNENITDALNNTKDVNSDQIQGDSLNHNKGTTPENDNAIPITPFINNPNVKNSEDPINKNETSAGNDNTISCLSNNSDLKIKGNSNDNKGTDNDPVKIMENSIVERLDIMRFPRDQPSTSTSNNNESGYPCIESNNDTSSNDTSSEDNLYERDSRLGTIGSNSESDSLSNSESDSFSSFVDSEDQNGLLLGGGMSLGNNRPRTNQPIRLKFTVSRS